MHWIIQANKKGKEDSRVGCHFERRDFGFHCALVVQIMRSLVVLCQPSESSLKLQRFGLSRVRHRQGRLSYGSLYARIRIIIEKKMCDAS